MLDEYNLISETSQVAVVAKNPTANAGDMRSGFDPWVGKIPWKKTCQLPPGLLSGESRRQRSLAGYSLQGHKESDTTEVTQLARTETQRTPNNQL